MNPPCAEYYSPLYTVSKQIRVAFETGEPTWDSLFPIQSQLGAHTFKQVSKQGTN